MKLSTGLTPIKLNTSSTPAQIHSAVVNEAACPLFVPLLLLANN